MSLLLSPCAHAEDWTVGAQTVGESSVIAETVATTLDHLRDTFPEEYFELHYYDRKDLLNEVKADKVFFFITDALSFAELEKNHGAWALAAMKDPQAKDASHTSGSAFIVRADRNDFSGLLSLKGATAIAAASEISPSLLMGLVELRRVFDKEDFFKEIRQVKGPLESIVHDVAAGKADVGIVDSCLLERMEAQGNIERGTIKVIGERSNADLKCRHSTDLYPGWVFGVAVPQIKLSYEQLSLIAKFAQALKEMPQLSWALEWSDPANTSEIFALENTLASLNKPEITFEEILKRYREYIYFIFGLLFIGFTHSLYAGWQVRRKTAQLTQMMVEKEKLEKVVSEERETITAMEKSGVAGQLSSMIAHELQQPLNAIVNYARGLKIRSERSTLNESLLKEAVSEIAEQGVLASEIVNKVRGYVKRPKAERTVINLSEFVRETVSKFCRIKHWDFPVECRLEEGCLVEGDRLELELLIFNLLKNSTEALEKELSPKITLTLKKGSSHEYLLEIEDNGPKVSEEAMRKFFRPGVSSKQNGLGLGLIICRNIAEAHGGALEASLAGNGRLVVTLVLPQLREKS